MIERRLKEAAEEIRNYDAYDYVLINSDLEESDAVLSGNRPRRARPADADRRQDPADSGDISSLREDSYQNGRQSPAQ